MAPWNTIASRAQRTARISRASSVIRSSPSNMTWPATTWPPGGSSRSIASAVVVLPEPDSPTRPIVSPRRRSNETSFTARSGPLGESNSTERLRTLSSGSRPVAGRGSSMTGAGGAPAAGGDLAPGGGA